jgi:hypothetical protein
MSVVGLKKWGPAQDAGPRIVCAYLDIIVAYFGVSQLPQTHG